ncbi:hypothetical protein EYC84_002321 [Monilinia fructicola]|uniref:Uncharacterized protein n=1 Tax=Monilinia fructicola TaxID=38448 RepID=A0A5M9JNJ8_MONFR|nr:hypothetical protein EYC84_002321 [Monilinia fructicola]
MARMSTAQTMRLDGVVQAAIERRLRMSPLFAPVPELEGIVVELRAQREDDGELAVAQHLQGGRADDFVDVGHEDDVAFGGFLLVREVREDLREHGVALELLLDPGVLFVFPGAW